MSQTPDVVVLSVADSKLKKYIVRYAKKRLNKKGKDVTVEDVAMVIAAEFPDLLLHVAEENYLAGYLDGWGM